MKNNGIYKMYQNSVTIRQTSLHNTGHLRGRHPCGHDPRLLRKFQHFFLRRAYDLLKGTLQSKN